MVGIHLVVQSVGRFSNPIGFPQVPRESCQNNNQSWHENDSDTKPSQ